MNPFTITVKTLFGLEEILAGELRTLGAENVQTLNRAVQFRGDLAMLYRCNLSLRTALKVLKPIAVFDVHTEEQLYRQVRDIDWSAYFNAGQTFAIDSTTNSQRFRHSKFTALKAKDAIVDQFRDRFRRRPSVDTRDPDLRINLHISDRTCTLSLDSSGDSLDRRGYRLDRTEAPINEVLAAGILYLSGWDGQTDLLDPMCGSGTFPIEAAMLATHLPPGRHRNFAFEKWNDFDRETWKQVREDAKAALRPITCQIIASDIDGKALEIAKENARRAKVSGYITFRQQDFLNSEAQGSKGWIIMNPPYGERLTPAEINNFYNEIGSRLKHHYEGWNATILSSNMKALKQIGLRTSRKVQLFNGALECKLHNYELYRGSRKGNE